MGLSYKAIGNRIRRYRLKQNITQEDLALSIGSTASYICHIEKGSKKPSLNKLVEIARILDVTVNDLVYPGVKNDITYEDLLRESMKRYSSTEKKILKDLLVDIANGMK